MAIDSWSKVRLKDLCSKIGDGLHGTPNYDDCGKVYFINGNNLNEGRIEVDKKTRRVQEEELKRNYRDLNQNSLLLSINGTLGSMAFYNNEKVMLGKSVAYINFKSEINRFYYYYFQLKGVQDYFYNVATGSTIKNLGLKSINEFKVPNPPEKDWKKIVKVLSDVDKKVELNNKINSELESMAKLIYDYWFVQFDFPDEKGRPYKSSGGKMVYNDDLKREIPEGWKACKLGDVINRTGTGLNPRKNFKLGSGRNYYVTIKNIKQGKIILDNRCDRIDDKALEVINNRSDLREGDVLFTSIQPVGVTYYINEKPVNWNINESVFTIRADSKKITNEFLYYFLSGDYVKSYTHNASAGSIHKGIRHGALKECKFILPEKNITNNFTNTVSKILSRHYLIEKENRKLKNLKEWLLPMLMNGQVTVN